MFIPSALIRLKRIVALTFLVLHVLGELAGVETFLRYFKPEVLLLGLPVELQLLLPCFLLCVVLAVKILFHNNYINNSNSKTV